MDFYNLKSIVMMRIHNYTVSVQVIKVIIAETKSKFTLLLHEVHIHLVHILNIHCKNESGPATQTVWHTFANVCLPHQIILRRYGVLEVKCAVLSIPCIMYGKKLIKMIK